MIVRLDEQQREWFLANMVNWSHDPERDAVTPSFEFANFLTAFAFLTKVARLVDEIGHHPEWSNINNKMHILLTMHDAGGLLQRDVRIAQAIDIEGLRFCHQV
jgi:4a-hydroxytetrahydrobiopterin dehydratase